MIALRNAKYFGDTNSVHSKCMGFCDFWNVHVAIQINYYGIGQVGCFIGWLLLRQQY